MKEGFCSVGLCVLLTENNAGSHGKTWCRQRYHYSLTYQTIDHFLKNLPPPPNKKTRGMKERKGNVQQSSTGPKGQQKRFSTEYYPISGCVEYSFHILYHQIGLPQCSQE